MFLNGQRQSIRTSLYSTPPTCLDLTLFLPETQENPQVLAYLRDVKNVLELRTLTTGALELTFPLDVGTVGGFSGRRIDSEIFYKFTSFLVPGTIYRCDLSQAAVQPTVFRDTIVSGFDAALFQTKQVFVSSKDGTKFPMFIVAPKDLVLDGSNPALLYG